MSWTCCSTRSEAVDEREWLTSTDPQAMLAFLRNAGTLSERKARLFAAACCRRVGHLLTNEPSRFAVEVGERYADGLASFRELVTASRIAGSRYLAPIVAEGCPGSALFAVFAASREAARTSTISDTSANPAYQAVKAAESVAQADLLRDVVGNPFSPTPPLAASLWVIAVALAEAAYQERELPRGHLDPVRLAVLADALEEGGAAAELIGHLRGPGPHVRGCHVLDLILGKA
jgi:hypothetical protein